MANDFLRKVQLHRRIFGVCTNSDCGKLFRLSDCRIFTKGTRNERDWMDNVDIAQNRIDMAIDRFAEMEPEIIKRALAKGRSHAGRSIRKFGNVFGGNKYNPDDAKIIIHPVDFVVFDGMKEGAGQMRNIILYDSKRASTEGGALQKSIKDTVEKKQNYEWITLRVSDSGVVTQE